MSINTTKNQGFIQALLLTSVFHEGLSFMDVGHNPTCISTLTLAVVGSRGYCKPPFDYFSTPRFSNSLSIKTQNSKSREHIMMLKQGVKTINAEFIQARGLSQLSFVQFRPSAVSFVGLLLSLKLISKSKKTLEMSLDLMPLFKISADCWCKGRGSCFECGLFAKLALQFYSKQIWQKKKSAVHTHFILWRVIFLFVWIFYTVMTPKSKKE